MTGNETFESGNYLESAERESCGLLDPKSTGALRGILAVLILFAHLHNALAASGSVPLNISHRILGVILHNLAFLSVGMFFFLSGYGISIQHLKRGDAYLKNYWKSRVLPTYVFSVLLVLFYTGFYPLFGIEISGERLLSSLTFGGNLAGWFIQVIIVLYILVYFVFRIFRSKINQLIGMTMAAALFTGMCIILGMNSTWYEGVFCFPFGMLMAYYGKVLRLHPKITEKMYLFLALILFLVTFCAFFICEKIYSPSIATGLKIIVTLVFCNFCIAIMRCVPLNRFRVLQWLGKRSLEIYVLQDVPLTLFHSEYIFIQNWILYSITVVICTVAAAWGVNPIFSKIKKLLNK